MGTRALDTLVGHGGCAYQTGYFNAAHVRRFGLLMLGLTIAVIVAVIPYWRLVGLPLMAR